MTSSAFVPMSADAIVSHVKSRFNFTVDKFPLAGPDSMRTPFYGLFRSDTMEVVGEPVSARYEAHQTDDVLAIVEAAAVAFEGVADVRCHFNDGHHLIIQPAKQHRLDVFGTEDSVWPRIFVRAGYDASAFRASLGMYRDACKNLMRIKAVTEATYCVRHVVGLRDNMDAMIRQFQAIGSAWNLVCEKVLAMESVKVNLKDILTDLFGEVETQEGRSRTIAINRLESICNRIWQERSISGRRSMGPNVVSGWEVYNGVQGWVQHDKTRRGCSTIFDRVILADADPIVSRTEELVLAAA